MEPADAFPEPLAQRTDTAPVDAAPAPSIVEPPALAEQAPELPPPTTAAEPAPDQPAPSEPDVRSGLPLAEVAPPAAVVEDKPAPRVRASRAKKKTAERTIASAVQGGRGDRSEGKPAAAPRKPLAVIEGGGQPLPERRAAPELQPASRPSERDAFWARVRELVDELPDEPRARRGHIWDREPAERSLRFTDHGDALEHDREPGESSSGNAIASASAVEREHLGLAQRTTRPAKVTIAAKRITKEQIRIGLLLYPEHTPKPRTRGECANLARPCPFVSCRHHLYLDVAQGGASFTIHDSAVEVWDMPQSCSLDVAEQGPHTLDTVGLLAKVTRERVRQIEIRALARVRRRGGKQLADWLVAGVAEQQSLWELALGS